VLICAIRGSNFLVLCLALRGLPSSLGWHAAMSSGTFHGRQGEVFANVPRRVLFYFGMAGDRLFFRRGGIDPHAV